MFYYVKRCSILLANQYLRWMYWFPKISSSICNTLYIFLWIIANRSLSLLSRLHRFYTCDIKLDKWNWTFGYIRIQLHGHLNVTFTASHIMRCIHRFVMYEAHALYTRPPYAIELRWLPSIRGLYTVHTPLALWIRNGQVLIRNIIRHMRRMCVTNAPSIRSWYETHAK